MRYYAHTAISSNGTRDSDESRWQTLADHLKNVANLAASFAAPFGASEEARLAGLLHDLGKYRDEFQQYLRGQRESSVETQHAIFGAAWAADEAHQILGTALAIAGHHAGLHNRCDIEAMCAKRGLRIPETVPFLIALLESELGPLPSLPAPPAWACDEHSAEFYARLIFSCIVDADRLDTAHWPASPPTDTPLDTDTQLAAVHAERADKTANAKNLGSPLAALRNRIDGIRFFEPPGELVGVMS